MTTLTPGTSDIAGKGNNKTGNCQRRLISLLAGFCLGVASSIVHAQAEPVDVPRVILSDGGPQLPASFAEADSEGPTEVDSHRIASRLTQSSGQVGPFLSAVDSGFAIDTSQRAPVSLFYKTVFAASTGVASGWNGNTATCNGGDTTPAHKAATLRRINWFRAMAGVPANVQFDASFNQKAQQAALLIVANLQVSHFPANNLLCYNAAAAEASSKSNLALGVQGSDAVVGYIKDSDANNAEVGHRRWLLYPQTQVMGTGDVDGNAKTNALWVIDGNNSATRPAVRDDFVAWPPRGYVPYQTVYPRWSFSYPQADFANATLTMTQNGVPITTRKEALAPGFGENTLVWFPDVYKDGDTWARPSADTVYQVTLGNVVVNGVVRNFAYSVIVFDPEQAVSIPLISGSDGIQLQKPASFTVSSQAGASDYQWRGLLTEPDAFMDNVEAGLANFTPVISDGYVPVTSDLAASGALSFHLAHPRLVNQILELKPTFLAGTNAILSFNSRLGLASTDQIAKVEVSLNDGTTWTTIAQQAGNSNAETGFTNKAISLAAFAGRVMRLRFNYAFDCTKNCSAFNQATTGTGWYFDDIQLTDIEKVTLSTQPAAISGLSFTVTSPVSGLIQLQGRAGMYGHYGEWGRVKAVTVGATANTGIISGSFIGDPANPTEISNARIITGAFLENVVIGTAVVFEAGVQLGKNAHFMTNAAIPAGIDLTAVFTQVPFISGSPGQGRISLDGDVLTGATQSVMDAIKASPAYNVAGSSIQQDGFGEITITLPDSISLVRPVTIKQNSSSQAPGTYVNEDGDLVFVTASGRAVIAYPLLVDRQFVASRLVAQGLSLSFTSRSNLKVGVLGNPNYFMARPTSAVRAFRSNTEGLVAHPLGTPANLTGYTIVFRHTNGVLMEQLLVPVPVDWPTLGQTLASIPGMANVRIDGEGVISVVFNNRTIRARTGYPVTAGAPINSSVVSLANAGDLNNDGVKDILLTYPGGEKQTLYIYPQASLQL